MTTILVTGLLAFDSGKTSVALSLVKDAVSKGIETGICKPVSAFSAWYQYGCVLHSIKRRKLIGEDIYRLHLAVGSDERIEVESPVAFLHAPPDPERAGWETSPYTAMGLQDSTLVYRISDCEKTEHYVIHKNLGRVTAVMRKEIDNLLEFLDPPPIEPEKFVLDRVLTEGRKIADECVGYLAKKYELLLIESFNNTSAPTLRSLDADKVVVVAPGKLAVYRGKDYRRALYAISNMRDPWRITVGNIVNLIHPESVVELRPDADGDCGVGIQEIIDNP